VRVTGCRWRDRPRRHGAYPIARRRLQELQEKGVWQKILRRTQVAFSPDGRWLGAAQEDGRVALRRTPPLAISSSASEWPRARARAGRDGNPGGFLSASAPAD